MHSLKSIIRVLQKERHPLSKKIKLIDHGLRALGSLDGSSTRRRMSAAARRKIARAQEFGLGIVQRLNSLNSTLRHADPSNATEITVTFLYSLHAEACLW